MKLLKYLILPMIAMALVMCESSNPVASDAPLTTHADSISYSFGVQIGNNLEVAAEELSVAAMAQGLRDALEKRNIKLSDEEIMKGFNQCQNLVRTKYTERQQQLSSENLEKGAAFLEENKAKDGVVTLPSGLQYKVIQEGNGAQPGPTDKVKTHYRGTTLDGNEFDSSYKRGEPSTFGLNRVIKGWTEGIQLMKEGAKYEFYIPANLAYGQRGNGNSIPPNSTLIFEVELIEVVK